jgi:hypothetical protein
MSKAVAVMKAVTECERQVLRAVLSRGGQEWNECPCGWFYSGPRCPDKDCKEWKKAWGTKRFRLYASADKETAYYIGRDKVGLEGDALSRFSRWGDEIEFEVDIDTETGDVKLVSVNGHKISP